MNDRVRSRWQFGKTKVQAAGGMVVAGKTTAAEAGVEMLALGGNAVDAAVAAGWAIAVTEPWMNGVGGCGAMVVHNGSDQVAIDFGIRAPAGAHSNTYEIEGPSKALGAFGWPLVRNRVNEIGCLSIGVPGLVAGLCLAHERFGRLPLETVMEPAIQFAESGFDADWHTTLMVGLHLEQLAKYPVTGNIFVRDGGLPKPEFRFAPADKIIQRDLAETLRAISKHGPAAFYRADLGAAIADHVSANGGMISSADLARYAPVVYPAALRGSYRGIGLLGLPGASGGQVLLETLNILEGYDIRALAYGSVATNHLIAEASRQAYEDHFQHARPNDDPPGAEWVALSSKDYAMSIRRAISIDKASGASFKHGEIRNTGGQTLAPEVGEASHTTNLCAIDAEHNAVSITQTLGLLFGSTVTVPQTGVLLNDMMAVFDPRPNNPHSVHPGGRQAAPYTPTLLFNDRGLLAAVGAPGGRRIPTAIAQVISNIIDHDMDIQEAIAAPRLHAESQVIEIDDRFPEDVLDGLRRMGHQVAAAEKTVCSYNFANPIGIMVANNRVLVSGTDPMMPSAAVGLA